MNIESKSPTKSQQTLGIAVFVKTPNISPLKTRLAKDLGQDKTMEFYRLSLHCLEQQLHQLKEQLSDQVEVYWSIAEEDQLDHPQWQKFSRFWQGEGGLGDRLFRSQEFLFERHSNIAFLGADLPILDLDIFHRYVESSKTNHGATHCQFGPTEDGGFYLYLANSPLPEETWTSTKYSEETTLSELKTGIIKAGFVIDKDLPAEADVDFLGDLKTLKKHPRINEFNRLANFLETHL